MKLLITTQKVDINDDVLGFFYGWIAEFAKHCEGVTVICLYGGEYNLPPNVKVLSLGKEKNCQLSIVNCQLFKKLKYIFNFYRYIWQERKNYDAVFAHMNSEYVALGGILWRFWAKKVSLWNNHAIGNLATWIAVKLAHITFYTSPFSFNSKISGSKGKIMPAGIDTNIFKKEETAGKIKNSLLFLGRISPIKRADVLIKTIKTLDEKGADFVLNVVGEPAERDKDYYEGIKKIAEEMEKRGKIKFFGKVKNYETPAHYNKNEIFINLTNSGSLDKTILEAMACESLVLISNESFRGILPPELMFKENDNEDLKIKLMSLLKIGETEKRELGKKLREEVIKNHDLTLLVKKILLELKK
ncbi:glycosyltransferase family 4 protein [Candidatus Falkowbacteria bacterium]|nr:glycosyltransferase family 4 protein [Candidatus Falkowbacteria bacterium]